ncbi:MAG: hypothetical protein FJY97_14825, partial [candidate division Zixibacteria bacterium]|nr:hypothetical protein [candidate division Zixibacteria bacterium]
VCRERGTAFGCGTACWEVPNLLETAAWIREGHIGRIIWASIPGGLPREASGAGCVQLTMLRTITGQEVVWAEGAELPPESGWEVPPGEPEADIDCGMRGWLGLTDGGVCEIPEPSAVTCRVHVKGENGEVWLGGPRSVLIEGTGASASPVYPDWLTTGEPKEFFTLVVERLMRAFDTGGDAVCSGHDYRQALEIAIALKQSAHRGGERVSLPLSDRSLRVFPHPYRLKGGDVAGYASIGYAAPPDLPE